MGVVRVWYLCVVGIVFVGCDVCVCVFVCVWSACVFYVGLCGVGACLFVFVMVYVFVCGLCLYLCVGLWT